MDQHAEPWEGCVGCQPASAAGVENPSGPRRRWVTRSAPAGSASSSHPDSRSAAQDPHGHHRATAESDRRCLTIALAIVVAYMAVEIVVSILSGSLALLADAGHMLTDAGAIGGSIWALHLAGRPESHLFSYGLKRAEILAAAANGVTLLVVGLLVASEAARRLVHPSAVHGLPVLLTALVGVVANVAAAWVLGRANRRSLNVEGAFQHILTDLYGVTATAAAAVVIIATGWRRADAVASFLVVALVLRAAWRLLKASGHVLLEGTPESVNLADVRRHLHELPEVVAVHDLHAWALTSELPALSAHVVVTDHALDEGRCGPLLDRLQHCLAHHFDVEHSTFQFEAASHADHEPGAHA